MKKIIVVRNLSLSIFDDVYDNYEIQVVERSGRVTFSKKFYDFDYAEYEFGYLGELVKRMSKYMAKELRIRTIESMVNHLN